MENSFDEKPGKKRTYKKTACSSCMFFKKKNIKKITQCLFKASIGGS